MAEGNRSNLPNLPDSISDGSNRDEDTVFLSQPNIHTSRLEHAQLWTQVNSDDLRRILASDYQQCHMCNGYYGSNNSQPVCSTCHLFLYAVPDLDQEEEFLKKPHLSEPQAAAQVAEGERAPADSDDSGTEQPDPPTDVAEEDDVPAAHLFEHAAVASSDEDHHETLHRALANLERICPRDRLSWHGDRLTDREDDNPYAVLHCSNSQSAPLAAPKTDKSLSHSSAYLLHLKSHQLNKRVRDLTQFNTTNSHHIGQLVENLPPEVLLQIFQHLDDFGLWSAKNVCTKWAALIDSEVADKRWEMFVRNRWPLFNPRFIVNSWSEVYNLLVNSASCLHCLPSMILLNSPPICEKAWKHRRLASELRSLQKEPPEGIQAVPLDKDCRFFQALINGPKGSPYEGGRFYLYLQIPKSYPLIPPYVQFITKVLHPNVSRHGNIGLDSIHHNWSLALTLSKILLSIQSLLTDPYLKVCMEPALAKLYSEDRNTFNQAAREWTWRYGMAEVQQVYFGHVDLENGFQPFTASAI